MKKNTVDKHTYTILWSEEDQEYVGICPDFPSLSWLSPTQEGALRGIKSVVNWEEQQLINGGM